MKEREKRAHKASDQVLETHSTNLLRKSPWQKPIKVPKTESPGQSRAKPQVRLPNEGTSSNG